MEDTELALGGHGDEAGRLHRTERSLSSFTLGDGLCCNCATCFKDQQQAASALKDLESVANSQGPDLCQVNK